MSTRIWRGDAVAVAQVTAWAFAGTWEATDIVNITINTKTVSVTAGSTTITTIIDTIVTALNASTIAEFTEITWSRSSSSLVGTCDTAGVPFTATLTSSETGGGNADSQDIDGVTGATLTATGSAGVDSTACTGPNFWSNADNWTGNAVPVNSDDVYFQNNSVPVLYGLGQSAVTLTSLNIMASYTGTIGLPLLNESGSYYEYRSTYLAVSATTLNIGQGQGGGSGRLKIATGSNACTLNVFSTGSPLESGISALLYTGTHASNVANIYSGSVGIAQLAGETSTVPIVRISYLTNIDADSVVVLGAGCTLTTIDKVGGDLTLNAAATTITQTGGTLTTYGSGAITTVNLRSAGDASPQYFYACSSGTITTLNIAGDETVADFSRDMRAKTVTTTNRYGLSRIRDPFKVVTFTNGIDCEQSDARNLELGSNINVARAAVS